MTQQDESFKVARSRSAHDWSAAHELVAPGPTYRSGKRISGTHGEVVQVVKDTGRRRATRTVDGRGYRPLGGDTRLWWRAP